MANSTVDLVDTLIEKAIELREEKVDLLTRIGASRRSLRDLATQGMLSEEQEAWLADFYVVKTRGGSDDEIEA